MEDTTVQSNLQHRMFSLLKTTRKRVAPATQSARRRSSAYRRLSGLFVNSKVPYEVVYVCPNQANNHILLYTGCYTQTFAVQDRH